MLPYLSELFLLFRIELIGLMLWILWSFCKAFFSRKKESISFFHPASLIATCFGIGKIPFMSGTWGTLFAANLIAFIMLSPTIGFSVVEFISSFIPSGWGDYLLLNISLISKSTIFVFLFGGTILSYIIGLWASNIYVEKTGREDPKEVVIDEVAGLFTAASLTAIVYIGLYNYDYNTYRPLIFLFPYYLILLFILFRIFDIWKPYPIGKIDREVKGGLGIMLDDIVAGIFSFITFYIIFFTMQFTGGFFWFFSVFFPDWIGQPTPDKVY